MSSNPGKSDRIGIVIPALDEAENLREIVPVLVAALHAVDPLGEILVVDDGSTDGTDLALRELSAAFPSVRSLSFSANRGKAAALQAGFESLLERDCSVIVMMDADGQDDPRELSALVSLMVDGVDMITGSRLTRRDRFIKRSTSRLFNGVTRRVAGVEGSDFNSGYKVMTAECARSIVPMMYGEMHRYIPVLAQWLGFRCTEVEVEHRPRLHGRTKYGINRFWRGLLDLITVRFLMSYRNRPAHLFGAAGFTCLLAGAAMLSFLSVRWLQGNSIGNRPMLIIGVLLVIVGVQLILFGLLAELVVFSLKIGSRSSFRDDRA